MTEKSVLERLREDVAKVCDDYRQFENESRRTHEANHAYHACAIAIRAHDLSIYESARPCTCHPADNPPVPCAKKYALSECKAADPDVAGLIDRLNGRYTIPVNDGAGLLNGKDTFSRTFTVPSIQLEAAAALQRQAEENKRILTTHVVVMKEADKRYDSLCEELAEVRKDAQRYRWLRDYSKPDGTISPFYLSVVEAFKETRFRPEQVDARIDAALSEGKP